MKTSPTRLSLLTAALAGAAFLLATNAWAEGPAGAEPRSLIARRCKDDAEKLCPGIAAGGGRLAKCLRGHAGELSPICQQTLGGAAQPAKASEAATPPPTSAKAAPAAPPAPAPAKAAPPAPPVPAQSARPAPAAPPAAATAPAAAPTVPVPTAPMPGDTGAMMGMRRTCANEIEKLCGDVQPGQGRLAVCLNEHGKELSAGCKKAVNLVLRQMNASMETHQACAADVEQLCGQLQPGAGRVAFCLGEHAAQLSPGCKQQIAELQAAGKRPTVPAQP